MAPTLAAAVYLLAALLFSLPASHHGAAAAAAPSTTYDIPAVFAFGDSTLDAGNNNRLLTLVRADHPPYGRDFPGGAATGRFSDGKLTADFVVAALGIKDVLPAYSGGGVTDAEAATGVSFASGGSGLDDITVAAAMVASVDSQVSDFEALLGRVRAAAGDQKADELVKKALVIVAAGTNDVIMNYYALPTRRVQYTLRQYHGFLLAKLRSHIQNLYRLGARRISVAGLPPIGCLPVQITQAATQRPASDRRCIADQNTAAESYNSDLQQMLSQLQSSLGDAKFVYIDIYTTLKDMTEQPQKYGFTETNRGCCGTGLLEMGPLCASPLVQACASPSQFIFWDSVHPSQATYKALADYFMQTLAQQFGH